MSSGLLDRGTTFFVERKSLSDGRILNVTPFELPDRQTVKRVRMIKRVKLEIKGFVLKMTR